MEDFKNHNLLRNNLDYIKEQLAREEKFVRKEIEQIKLEQQFCMIVWNGLKRSLLQ